MSSRKRAWLSPATMSSPSSAGSPAPEDQQVFTAHEQPPPAQEDLAAPGDDELEDSFFPSPAHYYKRYTTVNLALGPTELLPPIDGEPACLAAELLPPDVEAIVQRGAYEVFGETWPVEEVLPSLTDMGVEELFDRGAGESIPAARTRVSLEMMLLWSSMNLQSDVCGP